MHGGDPSVKPRPKIQYRDTDVEIIGPAAKEAILEFLNDWAAYDPDGMIKILRVFDAMSQTSQNVLYPPSEENAVVRIVRNRPRHDDCAQYIKKLYMALLRQVPAGEEVHIANAYLLPRKDLRNALIAAADRGVRISLMTNAPCSAESEGSMLGKVSHALFRDLLKRSKHPENFRFFQYVGNRDNGHNAMHQKYASFGKDGPFLIGSSNLDEQSLHYNREIVALVFDARRRAEFDRMWRRDTIEHHLDCTGRTVGDARELTPAYLRHERFRRRFRARLLDTLQHWL
jgi:phosphatidylserine/phosphatidylglycerophosphate/cardiolipin synthase-like enzyme